MQYIWIIVNKTRLILCKLGLLKSIHIYKSYRYVEDKLLDSLPTIMIVRNIRRYGLHK